MSQHHDHHGSHSHSHGSSGQGGGHHHILPEKVGFSIFIALIIGTIVTVLTAKYVDLGVFNFTLAMFIATAKALLVVLYFMGLKYDTNDNRVIFGASFIFLAIFLVLTSTDLFFRGDVHLDVNKVREQVMVGVSQTPKIKFNRFWEPSSEMLAHGKSLYDINCMSCHGTGGKGDGPASGALKPPPRNFTDGSNWINGRKPTQIFKTLTKGVNQMPSFSTLPPDDLWGLSHYVASLGPNVLKDSAADLKEAKIDTSLDDGGLGGGSKTLPIDFAIGVVAKEPSK